MKKFFIVFLMFSVLASSGSIFATISEPQNLYSSSVVAPYFLVIAVTSNSLELTSSNAFKCIASTAVNDGYVAETIMELQIKNDEWDTIKEWSYKDEDWAVLEKTYYPEIRNKSYRLKITHKAFDLSDKEIESEITYSQIVNY